MYIHSPRYVFLIVMLCDGNIETSVYSKTTNRHAYNCTSKVLPTNKVSCRHRSIYSRRDIFFVKAASLIDVFNQ